MSQRLSVKEILARLKNKAPKPEGRPVPDVEVDIVALPVEDEDELNAVQALPEEEDSDLASSPSPVKKKVRLLQKY